MQHGTLVSAKSHGIIDPADKMLALAREKVPACRFPAGRLEDLGVPSAAFDLAVCSLALTHVAMLDQAMFELARVPVPGARLVLSDLHPMMTLLAMHAFFPVERTAPRG
jgi:ubiquinone/menaquinone biosynthesis C-methylase UbiE